MARGGNGTTGRRRPVGAALWLAAGASVLYFTVEGGEYGTSDLLRVRRQMAATRAAIDSLERLTDSLRVRTKRLQGDVALQERIAREEFGMVKGDRELLYRFIPADTAADDSSAAR